MPESVVVVVLLKVVVGAEIYSQQMKIKKKLKECENGLLIIPNTSIKIRL